MENRIFNKSPNVAADGVLCSEVLSAACKATLIRHKTGNNRLLKSERGGFMFWLAKNSHFVNLILVCGPTNSWPAHSDNDTAHCRVIHSVIESKTPKRRLSSLSEVIAIARRNRFKPASTRGLPVTASCSERHTRAQANRSNLFSGPFETPQIAGEVMDKEQVAGDGGSSFDWSAEAVFPDDFSIAGDTAE